MAKKLLTQSTVATDNIQNQPDQVKGQASALKLSFDQTGIDAKSYNNSTLLVELQSETVNSAGANAIGAEGTFGTDNVADEMKAIKVITDQQTGDITDKADTTYVNSQDLILQGQIDDNDDDILALQTDKADDSAVVHNTGNESVAGVKTFVSSPIVPAPTTDSQASTKKYVDDENNTQDTLITNNANAIILKADTTYVNSENDDQDTLISNNASAIILKADDNVVVKLTGAQSIADVKTFSSLPIVPLTPTTDTQTASKGYVDTTLADAILGAVPDNSVTNIKLAPDNKVGSLALLTTDANSDVVSAINDVDAQINTPAYSVIQSIANATISAFGTGTLTAKLLARFGGLTVANSVVNGRVAESIIFDANGSYEIGRAHV